MRRLDPLKKPSIRNGVSQKIKPGLKLGILGGGQLARMMALSAHHLGIEPHIFSESKDDPAQQVVRHSHIGSFKKTDDLEKFLSQMDITTFESEFLDSDHLHKLSQKLHITIHPSPHIMGQLQDRLTQKTLLDQNRIPTAKWWPVANIKEAQTAVSELALPLVFKKRRGGYDGYGTFVVKTPKDLEKFLAQGFNDQTTYIAEKFIPFQRELACIFARSTSGEFFHYPLVESLQKDSRCFWVKGPVKNPHFSKMVKNFAKFLKAANYVGVMGVEFFETKKGLVVNELAPRVHNSGHYTMDAFTTGQFELHIKALLGQPLKVPTAHIKGFAMVNLLGNQPTPESLQWTLDPQVRWHWYGKKESRPGRKMGHVNVVDSTPNSALKKALKAIKGGKV